MKVVWLCGEKLIHRDTKTSFTPSLACKPFMFSMMRVILHYHFSITSVTREKAWKSLSLRFHHHKYSPPFGNWKSTAEGKVKGYG